MTNCGKIARLGATAVVLAIAPWMIAQVNQPNAPSSGAASQNSSPATSIGRTPDAAVGTNPNDAMNAPRSMSSQQQMDKEFVRKSIEGNHAEVDAGNLALQKSSNEEVKKFAQKMVDDHTAMLNEMTTLAGELQIKVPQSASGKDKAEMAKWSAMSGSSLDAAYVKAMVKDHKKDVSELTTESKNAAIPPVREAANKALPIVQGHLEMIEGIQKNMAAPSGMASTK